MSGENLLRKMHVKFGWTPSPHPGPLPKGEGESQPALGDDERVLMDED